MYVRMNKPSIHYSSLGSNNFDTMILLLCIIVHSTGWPSYASGLPGVEVQQVSAVQASLLGAEIRCATCGGHLGDVFNDGFIYVGTPAFETGKRFCVDGAALIFKPKDGSEDVFGDLSPPQKKNELPDFLQPPKIATRDV